jgi:hypothetical protein
MVMRIATIVFATSLVLISQAEAKSWGTYIHVMTAATEQVSLFCTPDGSGGAFNEAQGLGGHAVDATITVEMYRNDLPIVGYPAEDIWLDSSLGGIALCQTVGLIADGPTGADGITTISMPLHCGGFTDQNAGEVLRVVVGGVPEEFLAHRILINSPDMNGDLVVNLSDTILFTSKYTDSYLGGYDYAVDFKYDGVINLSDLVVYAQSLNTTCP